MMHTEPSNDARPVTHSPGILLICPHNSYRVGPYIQAAEQLNINVTVVSQGRHSLVSPVANGIHVDFTHPEQAFDDILAAIEGSSIIAVIGTDDQTTELAQQLSMQLGLAHNDTNASRYTRRKDLARKRLQKTSVNVPQFSVKTITALRKDMSQCPDFPVVVKPVSLSGSRGVIKVDNEAQMLQALDCIEGIVAQEQLSREEKLIVLVEQYIDGFEYAFEGMMDNGQLHCLALFDKPDMMHGPYFEETYYVTPSRLPADMQDNIQQAVLTACEAFGIKNGPIHAEVRINDGQVWFMEMAARTIGGECARLLTFATGMTLEQLVIRQAAGEPFVDVQMRGAAGVMMIPTLKHGMLKRVEGILKAARIEFIQDVQISVPAGYELVPLPEGFSYLGFIFARAPTPEQVEHALRQAYACLDIKTSPIFKVE